MDSKQIASSGGVKSDTDLPFELWRPIFQAVFAARTCISHPEDSDWEFSTLHARLNVYRCLASVCRSWRMNARDVFLEDLEVFTQEALAGLIKMFQSSQHLALAVSRLSFSFGEFRCSASVPRRPRALRRQERGVDQAAPIGSQPEYHPVYNPAPQPGWKDVHKRMENQYLPSTTAQGRHWARWHADVAQLLNMCTSLSDITIDSRNHSYTFSSKSFGRWFAPPDMTNDHIITSLLCSSNLRSLSLTDPTPLEMYGPTLTSWKRLEHLKIVLKRDFPELANTSFIPPKSLISLCFHDLSPGQTPWPLASDLARCTDLQVLDLGAAALDITTSMAIRFLCASYQHSLRELALRVFGQPRETDDPSFQRMFESSQLHFPKLECLRLSHARYDTKLFSYFTAEKLKRVEVHWLDVQPGPGSLEEKWGKGFAYSSLKAVTQFVIDVDDTDLLRKGALMKVCNNLDIELIMGGSAAQLQGIIGVDHHIQ